jgi:hypothetical protein
MSELPEDDYIDDLEDDLDDEDDYAEPVDESAASDTLAPGKGSGGGDQGRTQLMASVVAAMGGMGKEDLNKFSEVLAQFAKNKMPGAVDTSAKNKNSIRATGVVREDVDALFEGQDLSEEFKAKTTALFEAAVSIQVDLEVARLEEAFEEQLAEETQEIEVRLGKYLDHIVEEWLEENQIAIDSSLRVEATENFIEGLRNLFAENFIDVPDERLDIVGELSVQLEDLEAKLDEVINDNIELTALVNEATLEAAFEDAADGLALTQVEKLRSIAENLSFDSVEEYKEKLELVRENYFTSKPATSELFTESFVDSNSIFEETETVIADPTMNRYAQAITKTTKK